jgi:hypothetical protein
MCDGYFQKTFKTFKIFSQAFFWELPKTSLMIYYP